MKLTLLIVYTKLLTLPFFACYRLVEVREATSFTFTLGSTDYGYVAYYALYISTSISTTTKVTTTSNYMYYKGDQNILIGYTGSATALSVPSTITAINDYAFYNYTSITSVTFAGSVTSIGNEAFHGCSSLTSVTIPSTVTSIGSYAFYGCDNLSSIVFSDISTWYKTTNLTNWQSKTNGNIVSLANPTANAANLKSSDCDFYYWYKIDNGTTDAGYTVKVYLQNIEDDNYTICDDYTRYLSGVVGSSVSASASAIEHFTYNSGASTTSGTILADGSLTLSLYYTRNTYTVTFNGAGGTLNAGSASQTVKYGGSAVAPTYTFTGNVFDGWDKTFDYITGDITVTALWEGLSYTLYFDGNGGSTPTSITVTYGQAIGTLPSSTYPFSKYNFVGWKVGDTLITADTVWNFTADQTATAVWVWEWTKPY